MGVMRSGKLLLAWIAAVLAAACFASSPAYAKDEAGPPRGGGTSLLERSEMGRMTMASLWRRPTALRAPPESSSPSSTTGDSSLTATSPPATAVLPAVANRLSVAFAYAPPSPSRSDDERWAFVVTPYLWYPQYDLNAGVGNTREDGTFRMSEYFERVGLGGFILYMEATQGRWKIFSNTLYLILHDKFSTPRLTTDVTTEIFMATFTAGYRMFRQPPAPSEMTPAMSIYVFGGARYYYAYLRVDPKRLPGEDDSRDWMDPLIGAQVELEITPQISLLTSGSIGGFGVGSRFSWGAASILRFEFTSPRSRFGFGVVAGYKALAVDYEQGGGSQKFRLDLIAHGPVFGVNFRF